MTFDEAEKEEKITTKISEKIANKNINEKMPLHPCHFHPVILSVFQHLSSSLNQIFLSFVDVSSVPSFSSHSLFLSSLCVPTAATYRHDNWC